MTVPRLAMADNRPFEHIQSGEECGGAVPFVVMSAAFRQTWTKRKNGLGAIQSLDLAFLINAQHQRLVRRILIQSDDIAQLRHEVWIGTKFKRFNAMRL